MGEFQVDTGTPQTAVVRHLLRASFNHHPVLLEGKPGTINYRYTSFRFLEVWFLHPKFANVVE